MTFTATHAVRFYDAGTGDGQLHVADEQYFSQCVRAEQGQVLVGHQGAVTAISGTRYLRGPIGYVRNGDRVRVLTAGGDELWSADEASWVVGTVHPSAE